LHPIRPSANRGTHPRLLQRQRRTYTVLDLVRDELQTKVGAWRTRPGQRTASSRSSPTPPRRCTRTTQCASLPHQVHVTESVPLESTE